MFKRGGVKARPSPPQQLGIAASVLSISRWLRCQWTDSSGLTPSNGAKAHITFPLHVGDPRVCASGFPTPE
jgi:hypothetical protein